MSYLSVNDISAEVRLFHVIQLHVNLRPVLIGVENLTKKAHTHSI